LKQQNPEESETDDNGSKKNLAFMDMLLKAADDGEMYMSQKDIRDQVSTFMFEVRKYQNDIFVFPPTLSSFC
jgi:hypothetical protein